MKKIDNFNDIINKTDEIMEFDQLPIGPQYCQIKAVEDVEEKEYLKIEFDIVKGELRNYFKNQHDNFKDPKWPSGGTIYRSYKPAAYSFFASFIVALKKSNNDFNWDWNEQELIGLYFVANFGEEEYIYEGELRTSVKVREIRSITAMQEGKIKIPSLKLLPESEKPASPKNVIDTSTLEVDEKDLPF